jgi:hypothetical protein
MDIFIFNWFGGWVVKSQIIEEDYFAFYRQRGLSAPEFMIQHTPMGQKNYTPPLDTEEMATETPDRFTLVA